MICTTGGNIERVSLFDEFELCVNCLSSANCALSLCETLKQSFSIILMEKKSVKKVVLYSGHDLEYRDYFVIFVQVFVLAARKFSRYVQLVH